MDSSSFSKYHRILGISASWIVSLLLIFYLLTLILGLISLSSPNDPIGDPYFSILEILITILMPFMILVFICLPAYASFEKRIFAQAALVMMILSTAITSAVHFLILTVSRTPEFSSLAWIDLLLPFKWPSVAYSLDILAWDWFFSLSLLLAAPIFSDGTLEKWLRGLLILAGTLSLAGLIGIPLADMQVRMIGVVGYAGFTPVIFLLLGILFLKRSHDEA
jgi:hypothetical protein